MVIKDGQSSRWLGREVSNIYSHEVSVWLQVGTNDCCFSSCNSIIKLSLSSFLLHDIGLKLVGWPIAKSKLSSDLMNDSSDIIREQKYCFDGIVFDVNIFLNHLELSYWLLYISLYSDGFQGNRGVSLILTKVCCGICLFIEVGL